MHEEINFIVFQMLANRYKLGYTITIIDCRIMLNFGKVYNNKG